jgi:polyisoprenoid-binding protein YceI
MKRRLSIGLALLLTALAVTGSIAQGPQGPQLVQIDPQRCRVYVRVLATGMGNEHGIEGRMSAGSIVLGSPQAAGELTFDMASFSADSPAARSYVGLKSDIDPKMGPKVNEHMRGPKVLDIAKQPQAVFRIQSALQQPQRTSDDPVVYHLVGELTLHGVTKHIEVDASAEDHDGLLRLRGQFTLKQSDYGIKPYSKLLGMFGVQDELKVWGDLFFLP